MVIESGALDSLLVVEVIWKQEDEDFICLFSLEDSLGYVDV